MWQTLVKNAAGIRAQLTNQNIAKMLFKNEERYNCFINRFSSFFLNLLKLFAIFRRYFSTPNFYIFLQKRCRQNQLYRKSENAKLEVQQLTKGLLCNLDGGRPSRTSYLANIHHDLFYNRSIDAHIHSLVSKLY